MVEALALYTGTCAVLEKARRHLQQLQLEGTDLEHRNIGERYIAELTKIIGIVEFVAEYPQFASPAVASTIKDIEKVGQQFNGELATERERLDKLAAGGMTPVIFDGTGDRQKIDAIVSNLSHGKLELLAHLQRVQLGVVRTGGGIQVDIRTVREMDALLKERLGEVYGLRIAQLLHGRAVNETNGHVTFTSRDFATLTIDGGNPAATAVSDNSSAARVRRVLMNQTLGDALQINGPIGEDLWKDASEVIIEKNEASDEAIQMNYAVPDDVFREILRVRQPALRDAVVEVD